MKRLLVLLILCVATEIHPCAPAPPDGSFVHIENESAIIVWESGSKTQHFIRRATFQSDAADFGFLVPTPTKPELAEVSNDAFGIVQEIMRPRVERVEEHGIRPIFLVAAFFLLEREYETTAGAPAVRVLEMKSVAGYEAAVLEADDAASLNGWLEEHGYPSSPALQKWFEPYVAMKWIITAFKIAGDSETRSVDSSTVRMSFSAERPFFPYREPESEESAEQNRILQVLLLSDARAEGTLGDGAAWPGRLVWADRIAPEDQARLMKSLGLNSTQSFWLSAFEDLSSPRPGHDDLFFRAAADQSPKVPPPYVIKIDRRIPLPIDGLLVLAGLTAAFFLRKRTR